MTTRQTNGTATKIKTKRPRFESKLLNISNATLVRILVLSISFSSLSIPFILHFSLSDDCGSNSDGLSPYQTVSQLLFKSDNNVPPPRIRSGVPSDEENRIPPLYTLDHPPLDSPYDVIHTILTRFMVGQASQYTLAQARYLLFETFCWPTMWHQKQQNFYWLVLVDPGLDGRVLKDMQTLLQPMPNAFMVLTNNTAWAADGVGVENVTSYGVGLREVAMEFEKGTIEIVTGNTTYLHDALQLMNDRSSSKPILTIETLLDADDGLNNFGVKWIQNVANRGTQDQQEYLKSLRSIFHFSAPEKPSLGSTWWFLCGTDHIEWHNRDIFRITAEEYAISGLTGGLAGVRSKPTFCTSAGFTRIGLTQAPTNMTFPKNGYSNHALAFYFAPCTKTEDFVTLPAANISVSQCWRQEFPGQPFIIKSRSIGSDSMDNMNPRDRSYRDVSWVNDTDIPLLVNETENAWEILSQDFSISRHDAWTTSLYLYQNRKKILRENSDSRCSPGFPCYKAAKKNLVMMEQFWLKQEVKQEEQKSRKAALHELALKKAQERRVALWEKKADATIKPGASQPQHADVPITTSDANRTNSMEDPTSNSGHSEEGVKKG